jgi:hypothetical protein
MKFKEDQWLLELMLRIGKAMHQVFLIIVELALIMQFS